MASQISGANEQGDIERRLLLDELSRPRRRPPGAPFPYEPASPTPEPVAAPPLSPPADQSAAPDFSQYGQFMGGKNATLDPEKVASGHDSPKYQIARVLSHFDPRQGLTPEVIAALNSLGIGEFSSDNGQFLRVAKGDPRFKGVLGADMVRNFKAGDDSTRWGGWGSVGAEGPGVKPQLAAAMPIASTPPTVAPVGDDDGSVYGRAVSRLGDLERQILLQQLGQRRAQRRA